MSQLNFGLRVVQAAWRFHHRIPEPALWALLAASLLIGIPTVGAAAPITLASLLALVVAIPGIARWRITRRRARGRLVVPLFRCASSEKAVEVQDTILKTLQDHLSPAEMNAVHRLPAVVGIADRAFASKLCRRLRVYILLQGEIRQEKNGAWSVYAGTCQRGPNVRHLDPHTRDETPAKVRWKWAFQRLTGVDDTPQTEYPFEFAQELRAVIQGTAGQLAGYAGDPERAIRLLDQALAVSPASTSPQIDLLRIAKAEALAAIGARATAIDALRRQYEAGVASPELLRTLAFLLNDPRAEGTEADAREAIAVLRKAAKDRADPRRDQTLYNLSQIIVNSPDPAECAEAEEIMEELRQSDSHYKDAWYFKRAMGARAYHAYGEELHAGLKNKARAAEAARWYGRAIRARPKIRFFFRNPQRGQIELVTRFETPPIMFANARDGHREAGHAIRWRWYEWRFRLRRRRFMKKGEKAMRKGRYRSAIAYFDWVASVGRHDAFEGDAAIELKVALEMRDEERVRGVPSR
jgi:tetratricopeptide (TPR) repeat protein